MSVFVKNTGSAVNKGIGFSSFKPENWKVEFKPEKIEALEPGAMKQVEVTITPAAQALVGDYSVGISVDGEKGSSKTVELRDLGENLRRLGLDRDHHYCCGHRRPGGVVPVAGEEIR